MMGRTHALTGWCAGLAVAPLLGAHGVIEALLLATTTAGYALLPDLDHPGARASRLAGPVSGAVSLMLRAGSRWLYARTRGPRDEPHRGEHRHGTHTLAFAALVGTLVWVGTSVAGTAGVLVVLAVGTWLAVDALGDWLLPVVLVAGTVWWVTAGGDAVVSLAGMPGTLGVAVGVGCFVHCLGDALTLSGCPFLWPLMIRGETWFEIRPPRGWRFRTGGLVEQVVVFPLFTALGVLLVPGVWSGLSWLVSVSVA
ncbi:metal-dependent hydrolase [Actinosynnema sp. NPDC059335]|uniref:metal-dependent hydrolase n=1 Tax=Actinosynnema sp. NPDC059335 TaxID=3346804 RepID=UPI003672DFBF